MKKGLNSWFKATVLCDWESTSRRFSIKTRWAAYLWRPDSSLWPNAWTRAALGPCPTIRGTGSLPQGQLTHSFPTRTTRCYPSFARVRLLRASLPPNSSKSRGKKNDRTESSLTVAWVRTITQHCTHFSSLLSEASEQPGRWISTSLYWSLWAQAPPNLELPGAGWRANTQLNRFVP